MGDPVENNFPRCRLGPLNRVLLRIPVQENVQFRHFGNPTAVDFAVKLDRELHGHSLPPLMRNGCRVSGGAPLVVDQKRTWGQCPFGSEKCRESRHPSGPTDDWHLSI